MLVAGLRAGDIDFILGALRQHAPGSGLATEKLMSEPMGILVRHGHPLTQTWPAGPLQLAQLMDAEWILPRSNAPARALLDALFERMRLCTPVPAVETADLALIRGLLLRTDMVAALSAQQLRYECTLGGLTTLNVALPNTERDIGFIFREGSQPSSAARRVIDIVRKVALDFT
jgi:LysR family transcriptional regulator of gallate degradation